jgi:hypothetical protein
MPQFLPKWTHAFLKMSLLYGYRWILSSPNFIVSDVANQFNYHFILQPRDGATFYQVFPNSSSKSHVALTGGSDHENVPVYVHRMRCQGKFLPGCGNLYKKCFD